MKAKWLIEEGVFPEDVTESLISSLDSVGIKNQLTSDVESNIVNKDLFYIPYGSVGMVQNVSNIDKANIGIWYNPETLSMNALLKKWNKYLLNSNSLIVRLGDFRDNLWYFYSRFSEKINEQNVLFIKPCENDKSFTGMILLDITAEGTVNTLISDNNRFEKVNVNTMIVVSKPKVVVNEWRFFMLSNEIIACTQYNKNRAKHYEEGCKEPKAIELVNEVISVWQPDATYSLDICEHIDGKFYIMEVGCINCSDLYSSNKINFFRKITEYIENNS